MSFADKVNTMVKVGKLEITSGSKKYMLEMLEDGEIGIEGIGSIWGDDGLIKSNVDENIVDFIRNLEEFVDYKQNGISFSEVWELVAEKNEIADNKKLEFAKEFLNIDNEVIEVAEKLDEMSLDGNINLSDEQINNISFEEAKEMTSREINENTIGM